MIKIAIIGYGYWGPNLVRNFNNTKNCQVTHLADLREEVLKKAQRLYPTLQVIKSADEVINNPGIDAVVIATPVNTHYELAKKALHNDKHVLIEKPMTHSSVSASELIEIALKKKKVLMVDHTFLYNGAVKKIKEIVDKETIGKINYFDSTRINLGLFQQDINVLWDLAPHDISILTHLVKEPPYSVQAVGVAHTESGIENIAYMTVNYQSRLIAHFNCSWSSPVKIRYILIGGDKKMVVYNDVEPTEKVKIYDTGYSLKTDEEKRKILVDYRTGDIFTPKIDMREALGGMAEDFVNAILKGTQPLADYNSGLEVVKILEAANESIKNKGREVVL